MRKLTWATLSFSIVILFIHYVMPDNAIYFIMPFCLLLGGVGCFAFRGKLRTGILLICVFAAIGALRYEWQVHTKLDAVEPYIGNEYRVSAIVTEYPVLYDDCVKLTVRLDGDLIPKVKAVIYDYNPLNAGYVPGDYFCANVRFASALKSSGEDTDSYISKGIYLRGYITDETKIYDSHNQHIRYFPQYFGNWIRSCMDEHLSSSSAAFLNALLTGNKTALYNAPEVNNTLTSAGISHVVAVSGLHVSFVLTVSMIIFGSRVGWIFSVILMGLFAVMTGLSPSVMRAVFMQILFLMAPVLRRESDGITSISFALMILLMVNPFAISSVSLQLSFLSMAGIIFVTPKLYDYIDAKCPFLDGIGLRAYQFITLSLSTSLGATLFIAPVCAYYFGSIALLSPLTNLLVLWIVPYCFTGGFILCGLTLLSNNLAGLFANVIEWAVSFVLFVAKIISASPFTAIYLPASLMVVWFLFAYAFIIVMYLLRHRITIKPILVIIPIIISLLLLHGYTKNIYNKGLTVGAIDVGQGQCVVVMEGKRTIMVDCGGTFDAGDRAARWMYSHGREQVDVLILSHFDEDHVNGVIDLMTQLPVKEIIYSCNNLTSGDIPMLNAIKHQAELSNTRTRIVNTHSHLTLGTITADLIVYPGTSSNDGIMVALRSGKFRMLIMGDADFEAEAYLLRSSTITDSDYLVVGHHGAKSSTSEALLERIKPEYAIISCGYNAYGHPTQEVLDRLTEKNVVIYRTDQMGSIEVKVR